MKASYRRCNAGLLLHLRRNIPSSTINNTDTTTTATTIDNEPNDIVVGNAHLYWNPQYEYVKLSQAHYLLHQMDAFASHPSRQQQCRVGGETVDAGSSTRRLPVISYGEFNFKPGSIVHEFFTKGCVDARPVAPWNFFHNDSNNDEINNSLSLVEKKKVSSTKGDMLLSNNTNSNAVETIDVDTKGTTTVGEVGKEEEDRIPTTRP